MLARIPSDPLTATAITAILVLVALLVLSYFETRNKSYEPLAADDSPGSLQQDNDELRTTLKGLRRAAHRITRQIYPFDTKPSYIFDLVHYRYVVFKDGTTELRQEVHLRADERPLHFWTFEIAAGPPADPIAYLLQIGFQIEDRGRRRAVYLENEGDSLTKSISVFFLPQIEPDEPEARTIAFSFKWPRMNKKLILEGVDKFEWEHDSRRKIRQLTIELFFEPEIGRVVCEQNSPNIPGGRLERAVGPNQWPGWRYSARDAPAERFSYELNVEIEREEP